MNNELDAKLEKLMARRAELRWLQIRTAQLPGVLAQELALSEAFIAAATGGSPHSWNRQDASGVL